MDEIPYMVVKKDGSREKFDRQKALAGILKACEKRPVAMSRALAGKVEVDALPDALRQALGSLLRERGPLTWANSRPELRAAFE